MVHEATVVVVLVVRLLPKVEWLLHLWFSSAKWGWSSDNGSKLQMRVSKAWEGTGHLRVLSLMGYLIVFCMLRDSVILITESWRICFFQYGTRIDDIQTLSTIDFKHYFIKCFFFFAGWWWLYIIVSGQICSCAFILSSHYTVYGNYYRFQSFFSALKNKMQPTNIRGIKQQKNAMVRWGDIQSWPSVRWRTPHDRWLSCKLPWFCGTQLRWWKKSCTHLISRFI